MGACAGHPSRPDRGAQCLRSVHRAPPHAGNFNTQAEREPWAPAPALTVAARRNDCTVSKRVTGRWPGNRPAGRLVLASRPRYAMSLISPGAQFRKRQFVRRGRDGQRSVTVRTVSICCRMRTHLPREDKWCVRRSASPLIARGRRLEYPHSVLASAVAYDIEQIGW
jgi:hypothetical protein